MTGMLQEMGNPNHCLFYATSSQHQAYRAAECLDEQIDPNRQDGGSLGASLECYSVSIRVLGLAHSLRLSVLRGSWLAIHGQAGRQRQGH